MKLFINFVQEHQKNDKYQLFYIYNKPFTLQQDIDVLINHPELILLCDHCELQLNLAASVVVIIKERKDLCLTCFFKFSNENTKFQYCIRSNLNFYITQKRWNLMSQLLLFNGLQRYGYGHWRQIKNYLDYHGHYFSQPQIQNHFKKYYMSQNLQQKLQKHLRQKLQVNRYIPDEPQLNTSFHNLSDAKNQDIKIEAYNEKRQEYLFSYDPEAEKLIADMQFSRTDSEEERLLKILKLKQYECRRRQRKRREQFVNQYHLLSQDYYKYRLTNGIEKNKVRNMMSSFLRFMSYQQSQKLISNLTLQSTLRAAIVELDKQRRRHPSLQSYEDLYCKIKEKKQIKNDYRSTAVDLKVKYFTPQRTKAKSTTNKPESDEQRWSKQLKQMGIVNQHSVITYLNQK